MSTLHCDLYFNLNLHSLFLSLHSSRRLPCCTWRNSYFITVESKRFYVERDPQIWAHQYALCTAFIVGRFTGEPFVVGATDQIHDDGTRRRFSSHCCATPTVTTCDTAPRLHFVAARRWWQPMGYEEKLRLSARSASVRTLTVWRCQRCRQWHYHGHCIRTVGTEALQLKLVVFVRARLYRPRHAERLWTLVMSSTCLSTYHGGRTQTCDSGRKRTRGI